MIYQCGCGEYMENGEESCLDCSVSDSIENDYIDEFLEYEYILKEVPQDNLKKMDVDLKLQ